MAYSVHIPVLYLEGLLVEYCISLHIYVNVYTIYMYINRPKLQNLNNCLSFSHKYLTRCYNVMCVCLYKKLIATSPSPPAIFHMDNNVPRKVSQGITELAVGVGIIYRCITRLP